MRERMGHDFVFAPESCKWRDAGDGNRANKEQLMSPGNLMAQPAHFADVLLSTERVDHRTGRKEEQGLEEGMRHQMEYRGSVGADAAPEKHVSQLADGRIGQDAFDVVLDQTDCGGEERSTASNHPDPEHGGR